MHIAILSGGTGWHVVDLVRALEARGHQPHVLSIESLAACIGGSPRLAVAGTALEGCDGVLLRIIPRGSLEQIIFRIDALHWLERLGIPVLNSPRVIERTVDKFYTSLLLEDAGLKTPHTVVAERMDDAMAAFREMKDVVVKPLFGSNGRGIVRVTEEEIAYRVFRALELERAVYYVQETLPHRGRDMRVFVVGGRVLAAMWRTSDHWCTNIARGAKAERAELPPEWAAMSLAAAEAVGAEYAGVDLLETTAGDVHVLEVNGIPGWRGLQETTEIDVAGALVQHLETVVARR